MRQEVKSIAWDGFNHALKHWKGGQTNLYQHFKRYTTYTVLNSYKQTNHIKLKSIQDLANSPTDNNNPERTLINLIALKDLRKNLKGKNREALDDLIMGEQWDKSKGGQDAYYARRDMVKDILKGLLR